MLLKEKKIMFLFIIFCFFILFCFFVFYLIKNKSYLKSYFFFAKNEITFNGFENLYSSEIKDFKKIKLVKSYIKDNRTAYYKVFLPINPYKKTNAVIICPGGGYQYLSYKNEGINVAKWFQKKGYVAVVLLYRDPLRDNTDYPYNDLKETFKIIKNNSYKWNIEKIGVVGFSAGGHMAAFYSNKVDDDLKPDFTILYYPVISMKDELTNYSTKYNLLGNKKEKEIQYSVENLVNNKTPKTLIIYAKDDDSVKTENSKLYAEKLKKYNIPYEIHEFKSGGHGFGWSKKYKYQKQNKKILLKWLKTL